MHRKFTILIADDEEAIRELLCIELEPTGARLITAQDGQVAVDLVRTTAVDVALVDVRMPRIDGIKALELIRELSPDTVCIILTGNRDLDTVKACLRAGAYDFLEKPYDHELLLSTVKRALEKSLFQRERREFLEYLVCEFTSVTPEAFRALEPRKQAEILGIARGAFRLKAANRSAQGTCS